MLVFICFICVVSCTVLCVCKIISIAEERKEIVSEDEDFPEDETPPNGWTINDVWDDFSNAEDDQ